MLQYKRDERIEIPIPSGVHLIMEEGRIQVDVTGTIVTIESEVVLEFIWVSLVLVGERLGSSLDDFLGNSLD